MMYLKISHIYDCYELKNKEVLIIIILNYYDFLEFLYKDIIFFINKFLDLIFHFKMCSAKHRNQVSTF